MKTTRRQNFMVVVIISVMIFTTTIAQAADPLPSWNEGSAKQSIVEFVAGVTKKESPDYVKPAERIAVFDNDGTLWSEQPMYVQLAFAIDRVKNLAPQHPEWKGQEVFESLLKGDAQTVLPGGSKTAMEIIMATHTGMTTEEFGKVVSDWLTTARHPKTGRRYTDMVYQPMLELLAYLRANEFKTFIVSGGALEFMRVFAEKVYGVPPEQVVGSSAKMRFEIQNSKPVLVQLPEIDLIDDREGKPVGIQRHIGRNPIAAFGNSDGDLQMLQYTQTGTGARLMALVRHDDAEREYAYGPESKIGTFSDALLTEAKKMDWTVISMKNDWKRIFPRKK